MELKARCSRRDDTQRHKRETKRANMVDGGSFPKQKPGLTSRLSTCFAGGRQQEPTTGHIDRSYLVK